jgi:2',3'-cyclic-nucleotide 2'-phosphodiesterase (5'-nucleotidase family)
MGKFLAFTGNSVACLPKVFKIIIHLIFTALLLQGCKTPSSFSEKRFPAYQIGSEEASDDDSLAEIIIAPYRIPLEASMNEIVGISSQAATRDFPESSLGNLVCDLLLDESLHSAGVSADVCLMNTGGLRIDLPAGEISRSMVFELMPFENELMLASFSGRDLKLLLDQVAARGGGPVGGMRMKIQDGMAADIVIGNSALQETHIYTLLSSDYILSGGDRFRIPKPISQQALNLKVRDALLLAMIRSKSAGIFINPVKDGRIRSE